MNTSVLAGTRILCASPVRSEEEGLCLIVKELGGFLVKLEDVRMESDVQCLVTTSVLTPAYEVITKFKNVPMVHASWLYKSKEMGKKESYFDHMLKCLCGTRISLTGGGARDKNRLATAIVSAGGIYSPELTRMSTHLVIMTEAKHDGGDRVVSAKEKYCRRWGGIFIVHPDWVTNTVCAGIYTRNEAGFGIPPPPSFLVDSGNVTQTSVKASKCGSATVAISNHLDGTIRSISALSASTLLNGKKLSTSRDHALAGCAMCLEDDLNYLYLSNCRVFLSCCTLEERLETIKILREGGCIRRPKLVDDVTHIVVGTEPNASELQKVISHLKTMSHIATAVKLDWLRRCKSTRSTLAVPETLKLDAASLLSFGNPKNTDGETAKAQHSDTTDSGLDVNVTKCFEGLFFTLAALEGNEEAQYARRVIRRAGGRCFDRLTTVPEHRRVTFLWLEESLERDSPLTIIPYEKPEFRPLPFALPLPGMKDVIATASLYTAKEKDRIRILLKLLGGTYTVRMGRRNTHLLLPYADGEKFLARDRFAVKPVTLEWLLGVMRSGKVAHEDSYFPPSPPNNVDIAYHSQFPFDMTNVSNGSYGNTNPSLSHINDTTSTSGNENQNISFPKKMPNLFRHVVENAALTAISSSTQPLPSEAAYLDKMKKQSSIQNTSASVKAPSILDSLFTQLQSPAKGVRASNTPIKKHNPFITTATDAPASISTADSATHLELCTQLHTHTQTNADVQSTSVETAKISLKKSGVKPSTTSPSFCTPVNKNQPSHVGNGSNSRVVSPPDIDKALELIGGVLEVFPKVSEPPSQVPGTSSTSAPHVEQTKRTSRSADSTTTASNFTNNSGRETRRQRRQGPQLPIVNDTVAAQPVKENCDIDYSQQVGYEGLIDSRQLFPKNSKDWEKRAAPPPALVVLSQEEQSS